MNIAFVYDGNHIRTPELSGSILHGVTRDSILRMAPDLGYTVAEERIAIEDVLRDAQSGRITEAFGMGTGAVIAPVGKLGYQGQAVTDQPRPIRALSRNACSTSSPGLQYGQRPDPYGWTRIVRVGRAVVAEPMPAK